MLVCTHRTITPAFADASCVDTHRAWSVSPKRARGRGLLFVGAVATSDYNHEIHSRLLLSIPKPQAVVYCSEMQKRKGTANGHTRLQYGNAKLQRNNLHRSTPQAEKQISYLHSSSALPAFLIIVCPIFAVMLTYTQVVLKGDFGALMQMIRQDGVSLFVQRSLLQHLLGNTKAWTFIGCFAVFELILMRLIPGKRMTGPVTPKGNTPVYKANGLQVYFITVAVFVGLAYFKIFNPVDIYDNFPYIIGALCCSSLFIVFGLYLKGRFAPSSTDSSVSGAFFFDYFWGSELYPRVFGWDVKLFTNCRFGMMSWALLVICYAWKQYDSYGHVSASMAVSVALQLIYITKFFHWEMGYMRTLDIMHDRAGFMIVSTSIIIALLRTHAYIVLTCMQQMHQPW